MSDPAIQEAARKAFQLRAMIQSERLRVRATADVVTWNNLDNLQQVAKEITDALTAASSEACSPSKLSEV